MELVMPEMCSKLSSFISKQTFSNKFEIIIQMIFTSMAKVFEINYLKSEEIQ